MKRGNTKKKKKKKLVLYIINDIDTETLFSIMSCFALLLVKTRWNSSLKGEDTEGSLDVPVSRSNSVYIHSKVKKVKYSCCKLQFSLRLFLKPERSYISLPRVKISRFHPPLLSSLHLSLLIADQVEKKSINCNIFFLHLNHTKILFVTIRVLFTFQWDNKERSTREAVTKSNHCELVIYGVLNTVFGTVLPSSLKTLL